MKLSKSRFNRAIEGNTVATKQHSPSWSKAKPASKFIITVLIATIGIGAGWVGGKVLSGRLGRESAVAPPSDVSTGQTTAPPVRPPENPQPAKRSSSAGNSAASQEQQQLAPDASEITTEPPPKQTAREAPPRVPRVNKEEEDGAPAMEDPSKEIGRKALKKILKENEKMKRERGNKNENDQN